MVISGLIDKRQLLRNAVIYFTSRKIRNGILQVFHQNKAQTVGQEVPKLKEGTSRRR